MNEKIGNLSSIKKLQKNSYPEILELKNRTPEMKYSVSRLNSRI